MKNSGLEIEVEVTADYVHHIVGVMKERFGKGTIVLFHVADKYECFQEDSVLVSKALGIPQEPYPTGDGTLLHVTRFPDSELVNYRRQLTDEGYATCTNETRDKNGIHILKIYEPEQQ